MQTDELQAVTPLVLTDHARKRAQSRGVSLRTLEAIYASADRSPFVGGGCRSLMVSRQQLGRLADSIPPAVRERMEGVVLVVDPNSNAIITVFMPTVRAAAAMASRSGTLPDS